MSNRSFWWTLKITASVSWHWSRLRFVAIGERRRSEIWGGWGARCFWCFGEGGGAGKYKSRNGHTSTGTFRITQKQPHMMAEQVLIAFKMYTHKQKCKQSHKQEEDCRAKQVPVGLEMGLVVGAKLLPHPFAGSFCQDPPMSFVSFSCLPVCNGHWFSTWPRVILFQVYFANLIWGISR